MVLPKGLQKGLQKVRVTVSLTACQKDWQMHFDWVWLKELMKGEWMVIAMEGVKAHQKVHVMGSEKAYQMACLMVGKKDY